MWTCSLVPGNIKNRFLQRVQVLHPTKHTDGVLNRPRDFIVANISVRQTNRQKRFKHTAFSCSSSQKPCKVIITLLTPGLPLRSHNSQRCAHCSEEGSLIGSYWQRGDSPQVCWKLKEALCLQDGSRGLLFLFPHAWLGLKGVQHSRAPLYHEGSQYSEAPQHNPLSPNSSGCDSNPLLRTNTDWVLMKHF